MFEGTSNTSQIKRSMHELADYLMRELDQPEGVFLMTGTGIVSRGVVLLAIKRSGLHQYRWTQAPEPSGVEFDFEQAGSRNQIGGAETFPLSRRLSTSSPILLLEPMESS